MTPAAQRARVERWLAGMWRALDPESATARWFDDDSLIAPVRRDLRGATVFAFGKAAVPMARAVAGRGIRRGILIAPDPVELPPFRCLVGGHPLPSPDAARHGAEVLSLAASLREEDHALCLLSGGASALLELPHPGATLDLIRASTTDLMRRGADIATLNATRVGLSALKGGRLACAIAPAALTTLLIHDTPGYEDEVVASGPTLPSPIRTCPQEAPEEARAAWRPPPTQVPASEHRRILSNEHAVLGLAMAAQKDGVILRTASRLRGEAQEAGRHFVREARTMLERSRVRDVPTAVVAGGETTVTFRRPGGRGGRAHELVLGAAPRLREGELLVCVGTDGVDGNSGAAGVCTGLLPDDAALRRALAEHDTGRFAAARGLQLHGPRTTNVADVALFLRTAPGA